RSEGRPGPPGVPAAPVWLSISRLRTQSRPLPPHSLERHQCRLDAGCGSDSYCFLNDSASLAASSPELTMEGVIKTKSSLRVFITFWVPNRKPTPGISFNPGMPVEVLLAFSMIKPPNNTVAPSCNES